MTSSNSTVVYSEGDLSKFLNYVKEIRQVGRNHGFSACVVGGSGVLYLILTFLIVFSGRLMTFFGMSLPVFGFWALTRVFCSIFPLCQLPWSEGGAPYQRPNNIWFPAEASDVPDQDIISSILLCSRAVPHGYSLSR